MQPPTAPTRERLKLRGNYAVAAPDYTVEQDWGQYDADEHDIWRVLFNRQIALAEAYAAPEFLQGLELLGATASGDPAIRGYKPHPRAGDRAGASWPCRA